MIRDDGKSALDHGLNALAALFGLDSEDQPRQGTPRPPARKPCNCTGRRNPLPPMPGVRKGR